MDDEHTADRRFNPTDSDNRSTPARASTTRAMTVPVSDGKVS